MALNMHQHGINRSLVLNLREKFPDARVDIIFDGYKMPDVRPLITIEPLIFTNDLRIKQRDAVDVTYHYQVGLHDENSVQLSINQERLQDVFNFDRFTYFDTLKDPIQATGSFLCKLNDITPMLSDEISRETEYHRVYFDVEIITTKRRCV